MTDQPESPQPTTDTSDWEAKSEAHQRRVEAQRPANKTALFGALAAAGITRVFVTFDGYGDSGQIEEIEAQTGDLSAPLPAGEVIFARAVWGDEEPGNTTLPIREAIETLVYDCLEAREPGWENNDGAYGEFTFDVAAQTIALDFNGRFTTSELSRYVF